MSQRVPRVLYHYCSLPTFKNILDNKSIWLSDIRKSNDSLELKWIMGQCQLYMLKSWTDYVAAVQKERGMDIVSHEHFEMFQKLYDLAKDYDAEDDTKNWVFCLSEKADDLGQWRGYADDGKGIAIGFNSAFLRKVNIIGDSIRDTAVDFNFSKVHYSTKDVDKLFYNTVGLSKITVNSAPDDVIALMKRAVVYSYIYAPQYKNQNFKDEKEWRIVYSMFLSNLEKGERPGIPKEKNVLADEITLDQYAFIQKDNTLVSHLELGLPQIKQAVHSITIGPKAKISRTDLKLYLISIGLLDNFDDQSIKIHRSLISYR